MGTVGIQNSMTSAEVCARVRTDTAIHIHLRQAQCVWAFIRRSALKKNEGWRRWRKKNNTAPKMYLCKWCCFSKRIMLKWVLLAQRFRLQHCVFQNARYLKSTEWRRRHSIQSDSLFVHCCRFAFAHWFWNSKIYGCVCVWLCREASNNRQMRMENSVVCTNTRATEKIRQRKEECTSHHNPNAELLSRQALNR